jgi:hypothetical protein
MKAKELIDRATQIYNSQFENGPTKTDPIKAMAIIAIAGLIGKSKQQRRNLTDIDRNPTAKQMAIDLLARGKTYIQVTKELNLKIAEFKTTKSSVARFWANHKRAA